MPDYVLTQFNEPSLEIEAANDAIVREIERNPVHYSALVNRKDGNPSAGRC